MYQGHYTRQVSVPGRCRSQGVTPERDTLTRILQITRLDRNFSTVFIHSLPGLWINPASTSRNFQADMKFRVDNGVFHSVHPPATVPMQNYASEQPISHCDSSPCWEPFPSMNPSARPSGTTAGTMNCRPGNWCARTAGTASLPPVVGRPAARSLPAQPPSPAAPPRGPRPATSYPAYTTKDAARSTSSVLLRAAPCEHATRTPAGHPRRA